VARGTRGQRVYALIDAASISGLFRSDDSAKTWTRVGADPRIDSRAWYFSGITVDPQNPDVVYLPNVAVHRSTDGGKNFIVLKGAPGGDDYHYLWMRLTGVSVSNDIAAWPRRQDDSTGAISTGQLMPAYARYIAIPGNNFISNAWRANSEAMRHCARCWASLRARAAMPSRSSGRTFAIDFSVMKKARKYCRPRKTCRYLTFVPIVKDLTPNP
jgi:hypothetical protein